MEQESRRVALVTGGSRGLGRAIALELARDGADIALVYAGNEDRANAVAAEIQAMGRCAAVYRCDVSRFDQVKETVAAILADFGKIDILVNNAGITKDGLMLNMKEEQFDAVVDTNLKGAFNMTRHVYGPMMKKRYGRIVSIGSVVGTMGNAGQTNYAAAKAGLIGFTKSLAREVASRGITVNAVAPGFIETDMTQALTEEQRGGILSQVPANRLGDPKEIAAAVLFLASDEAAYVTGETLHVNGGMYMV